MIIRRLYTSIIHDHLKTESNMAFVAGPRQCGKTTTAKLLPKTKLSYWNWDDQNDRLLLRSSQKRFMQELKSRFRNCGVVILDEIHKNAKWKSWLKGFFDIYRSQFKIVVTGSGRLDIFQKGGDSLLGRYFLYRHHPLSIGELASAENYESIFRPKIRTIDKDQVNSLFEFGGFPEPLISGRKETHRKWIRTRKSILINEEVRDLTKIMDLAALELLAELLEDRASNMLNLNNLAQDLNVSADSIRRWLSVMERVYYIFTITPYSKAIKRSLLRVPKVYLWDWSSIKDEGAKTENFLASHILKAVHFWNDTGKGDFNLHYLRDKQKREVDFLILKDGKPFILAECKVSGEEFSSSLNYFNKILKPEYCYNIVKKLPPEGSNVFSDKKSGVVSLVDFCAALP